MALSNLEQCLAKRHQAQQIMSEMGIPIWIILVADNAAENAHLPLIGAPLGASHRAYILTPTKAVAISHSVEAEIQRDYGFEVITIDRRNAIVPLAMNLASIVGAPCVRPIALNYSHRYSNVDTLGHGSLEHLAERLNDAGYFSSTYKGERFISADQLIFTLASTKLPYEIDLLKEAAQVTNEVLVEGFKLIKPGMSEIEVANVFHRLTDDKIAGNRRMGYSWAKAFNPIVLTGAGIAGSPHKAPSDRIIEPGATVYIDFGISVDGYHGDLQHFGYVLKPGETNPPPEIERMFALLVSSINAGIALAKPGAFGWEVDKASRDVITAAGYPTYKHGTGHQLGAGNTHTPGVSFAPKFDDYTNDSSTEGREDVNLYSQLPVRVGYVMTIEPRIQISNGASIEVDGVVTSQGFQLFIPIQERIHLIQ